MIAEPISASSKGQVMQGKEDVTKGNDRQCNQAGQERFLARVLQPASCSGDHTTWCTLSLLYVLMPGELEALPLHVH